MTEGLVKTFTSTSQVIYLNLSVRKTHGHR